jgi:succinate dehydrogenase/fumarate reductase flavoprotein subunit
MGGIPTNHLGEVVMPKNGNPDAVVPGLFAAGEVCPLHRLIYWRGFY